MRQQASRALAPAANSVRVTRQPAIAVAAPQHSASFSIGPGLDLSRIAARNDPPMRIQAKLMVGQSDDPAEQEADRIAEQVMRMPQPQAQRSCPCGTSCAKCKSAQGARDIIRRVPLRTKATHASTTTAMEAPPVAHDVLRSPGVPLDSSTREFMESRFGRDFSAVRVHADDGAARSAHAVNARAYTVGRHVVFGAGERQFGSESGKRLLAHELAHVVQQSEHRAPPRVQRTITVQNPTGTTAPNTQSNGAVVTGLFNGLCPDTSWQIDGTGTVTPATKDFCSTGVTQSKMSTSCQCACNFTNASGPNASITIDPTDDQTTFAASSGPGGNSFDIKLRGQAATSITGATGAPVPAGQSSRRTLSDPAWLILGHEMCGHAQTTMPNISTPGRAGSIEHEATAKWDQSAVDIENRIRREHSTAGNDLGTRMGDYKDVEGNIHFGSVVQLPKAMTLITMMEALGVPTTSHLPRCPVADWYHLCGSTAPIQGVPMLDRVSYRTGGNFNVAARCLTQSFAAGDFLAVEGVFWHLADGSQTKTQIAERYGVTVAALDKANALFSPAVATQAPATAVPANSSVMVPYRLAPGSTRNFLTPGTGEC